MVCEIAAYRPIALSFDSTVSKYVRFALVISLHFYLETTDAALSKTLSSCHQSIYLSVEELNRLHSLSLVKMYLRPIMSKLS